MGQESADQALTEHRHAGLALVLICAVQMMVILDGTIVNIALPSIQHELHFSAPGLEWVITAYALTFGGLLLLGGRSGDLFIVPKPYWLMDSTPQGKARSYGTGHGTPYNYDQHVPILLMGFGIQAGEYHGEVTPADIAPTLASLCGVTLSSHDVHVLAQALSKPAAAHPSASASPAPEKAPRP